jgi:hypothetical protein
VLWWGWALVQNPPGNHQAAGALDGVCPDTTTWAHLPALSKYRCRAAWWTLLCWGVTEPSSLTCRHPEVKLVRVGI